MTLAEKNKLLVRRFYEEIVNGGNVGDSGGYLRLRNAWRFDHHIRQQIVAPRRIGIGNLEV